MQGIYTYIPETNYVPSEYIVAAILLLLFMVLILLASVIIIIIIIIILIVIIIIAVCFILFPLYRLYLFATHFILFRFFVLSCDFVSAH